MDRRPDVIVLGAGIIGCAVAYELARRGARVQVIDGREVGRGATQASAGVLAPYIEGENRRTLAELGVRSLHQYDEFVARVVEDSGMAVQYVRTGVLKVAIGEGSLDRLEEIATSLAALGVSTERLDARATREAEPELAESVLGGLLVPAYGFVAAGQLTAALERAASVRGATFVVSRSAKRVSSDAGAVRVETDAEPLTGGAAVLAAGRRRSRWPAPRGCRSGPFAGSSCTSSGLGRRWCGSRGRRDATSCRGRIDRCSPGRPWKRPASTSRLRWPGSATSWMPLASWCRGPSRRASRG